MSIITRELGEGIANNRLCYVDDNGEIFAADLSDPDKAAMGFVRVGGSLGTATQLFISGNLPYPGEATPGMKLYLSETPGVITTEKTSGTYQQVGVMGESGTFVLSVQPRQTAGGGDGVATAQTFFKI
jgi:hypothetical protein